MRGVEDSLDVKTIGVKNDIGRGYPFLGKMDEFRLYNRSLNPQEIYTLYISSLQAYDLNQWYFYANQSKNTFDSLDFGEYNYQMFAEDISGNANQTDLRNIILGPVVFLEEDTDGDGEVSEVEIFSYKDRWLKPRRRY